MSDQIQEISIDLVDDPFAPMRSEMDEEKLEELAQSIKRQGLVQPITVRRVGDRYEVVAGHRRLIAHRRIQKPTIMAVVTDLDEESAEEIKVQENLYREDINPVDEAHNMMRIVNKYGYSPAEFAQRYGKSESYWRARYDLMEYPDYLQEAVRTGRVSLTAAQWIAKISHEITRREYTRFAVSGGITAKRAEAWYRSWHAGQLPPSPENYEAPASDNTTEREPIQMTCAICWHPGDYNQMRIEYVHPECASATEEAARHAGTPREELREPTAGEELGG